VFFETSIPKWIGPAAGEQGGTDGPHVDDHRRCACVYQAFGRIERGAVDAEPRNSGLPGRPEGAGPAAGGVIWQERWVVLAAPHVNITKFEDCS